MGLDKVKKRYDRTIKNPPEVKEITTPTGVKVTLIKRRGLTLQELQEAQDQEYKDMGLSIKKLKAAGFDPDRDNPDDFCCDEYGLDE